MSMQKTNALHAILDATLNHLNTLNGLGSLEIGIWWLVQGKLYFVKETATHANIDVYDNMLTIAKLHANHWDVIKHQIPKAFLSADDDFGSFPRGRILYHDKEHRHYVYGASWLVHQQAFRQIIQNHYTLLDPMFEANEQYEIDTDNHLSFLIF